MDGAPWEQLAEFRYQKNEWQKQELDLSAYEGRTVRLRFLLTNHSLGAGSACSLAGLEVTGSASRRAVLLLAPIRH